MENWVRGILHFGEAQRSEVVHEIVAQIRAIPRTCFLDCDSDAARNRTLVTFVGEGDAVLTAAFSGIAKAVQFIGIDCLRPTAAVAFGVFTPLNHTSLRDCRELALSLGKKVGEELEIPVFLHGDAAPLPYRKNFEIPGPKVRGLIGSDPRYLPDLGPARIHPTAGSIALSAQLLFAEFDVYLQGPGGIAIATEIRDPLRGLRSLTGLFAEEEVLPNGRLIIACYLEDEKVSPIEILEQITAYSARHGSEVVGCDFAGLVPTAIAINCACRTMKLKDFRHKILEERLSRMAQELWCCARPFLNAVASENPIPTAGSTAALSATLAVALAHKMANVPGEPAFAEDLSIIEGHLSHLVREDSEAQESFLRAQSMPCDTEDNRSLRQEAMDASFLWSTLLPLDTMTQILSALEIASRLAQKCGDSAFPAIGMAVYSLMAALEGSALNLRCHLRLLDDQQLKREISGEAQRIIENAGRLRDQVLAGSPRL